MNNFKKLVDKAFNKNSSQLIYNSSKEHAKIIIDKLFEVAQNKIKLFLGGNDLDAYTEHTVQSILENKSNISLSLIIERDDCVEKVKSLFKTDNVHCLKKNFIDKLIIEFSKSAIEDPDFANIRHFMVVDDKAFRIELPHGKKINSVKAIASANRPALAQSLSDVFEKIKDQYCEAA
jgi:hypothetical protein